MILDRLDEMTREDQRVLVPLLDQRLRREGSSVERKIDVRFLATCRRMERLLPAVRDRLKAAVLELPPLRERREDLPRLVEDLLRSRRAMTVDALAILAAHRWEGNLAELAAIVERLVVLSDHTIGRNLVRKILRHPEPAPDLGKVRRQVYKTRPPRRTPVESA